MKTVFVTKEESVKNKKKEALPEDIVLRLEASLKDAEEGRIHRVR